MGCAGLTRCPEALDFRGPVRVGAGALKRSLVSASPASSDADGAQSVPRGPSRWSWSCPARVDTCVKPLRGDPSTAPRSRRGSACRWRSAGAVGCRSLRASARSPSAPERASARLPARSAQRVRRRPRRPFREGRLSRKRSGPAPHSRRKREAREGRPGPGTAQARRTALSRGIVKAVPMDESALHTLQRPVELENRSPECSDQRTPGS